MIRALFALLLLALTALPVPAASLPFCRYGKPTAGCVIDGDTFWLEHEKIRTLGYDTPEMGPPLCPAKAPGADAARSRLRELLNSGLEVTIQRQEIDRYGRTLAWLTIGGENLAAIMIREGHGRPWVAGGDPWC
jgi:micrococcal nuclease